MNYIIKSLNTDTWTTNKPIKVNQSFFKQILNNWINKDFFKSYNKNLKSETITLIVNNSLYNWLLLHKKR